MQKTKLASFLVGSIGALIAGADAQVLRYNNSPSNGTVLNNGDPVPNTGTITTPGQVIDLGVGVAQSVTQVTPPGGTAYQFGGDGGANATLGINSNRIFNDLWNATTRSFTASAFVRLDDLSGDNMVFGSSGAAPLHLGFRDSAVYFGFWGGANEDSNGGAGSSGPTGETHYWTWRYDSNGVDGTQSVFRDGVLLYSDPNQTLPAFGGDNLLIGTTNGNAGNLNGTVDDVRFYNTALTDAQVAQEYTNALVPEPVTFSALIGGAALLLGLRRRRR